MNRNLKTLLISRWTIPFFMVFLLTLTMSVRLLSDPDLGSHLKGGEWIANHHSIPQKDISTYTVASNEYIDIHWFFQLSVFGIYSLGGYKALSLLVAMLSLLLFLTLFFRNKKEKLPQGLTISLLLLAFMVLEPRIMLRPEMFSLIYLTLLIIILDQYISGNENLLFLMPVIMVVWCNMQGLFVLGLIVIAVYYISKYLSDKKPDSKFTLYLFGSVLVCLINPYFIRGFLFPFELFTRLEGENIFHQHIKELISLTSLDTLVIKNILFIIYSLLAVGSAILTIRRRKLHEIVLLILFLYLAVMAIRNIPLFVVISFPVFSRSLNRINEYLSENGYKRYMSITGTVVLWICIILPLFLIPRMITNAYYLSNSSYNKTGLGIDPWHQPVRAAEFINKNALHGKIINSLAFGGWLSWSLRQPVFIDGRLEVIKEPLYLEVVKSWNGNLPGLVDKYKPELLIYNYLKYYPWTVQLLKMSGWELIYLDGFTAIYAVNGSPGSKLQLNLSQLPVICGSNGEFTESWREEILKKQPANSLTRWLRGFYIPSDNYSDEILNMASFCLQSGFPEPAEKLFLQYLSRTDGGNNAVYYALADIYGLWKLQEPARICYKRILSFDPGNPAVQNALMYLDNPRPIMPSGNKPEVTNTEAVRLYNQGNEFFRNGLADKALNAYNEAIHLNPAYTKALNNRGILKASSFHQFREAIDDFNEVIRLDPANADAYLGRGSCLFQLRERDSACKDWEKADKLGNSRARLLLEQHCSKQGNN